jgi:MoxR-like ATPase
MFVIVRFEIHGIFVTAVGNGNLLMLGPAGIAKTYLAETVCHQIKDAVFFDTTVNKMSTMEQVFGPYDTAEYEKSGRWMRKGQGYAQTAHIVFKDECFKSNGPLQQADLDMMADRIYKEEGKRIPVPCMLFIGASNEYPEDGTKGPLAPVYDRFDLKFMVSPIKVKQNFHNMILSKIKCRNERPLPPQTFITVAELHQAQKEAEMIDIPDAVLEIYEKLWDELKGSAKGFYVSDRKFARAIRFIQANAWLEGRTEVCEDDLTILQHMLWEHDSQIRDLRKLVLSYGNPLAQQAIDLYDSCMDSLAKVNAMPANTADERDKRQHARISLSAQLDAAVENMDNLIKEAQRTGRSINTIVKRREELAKAYEEFGRSLRTLRKLSI